MIAFATVLFFLNLIPAIGFMGAFDNTQHVSMRAAAFLLGLIGASNVLYFTITIITWVHSR